MATLWPALSTSKRAFIAREILRIPSAAVETRPLAKKLGVDPTQVHWVATALGKARVLKNKKMDLSNPLTRTLKKMFNIMELNEKNVVSVIKKNFKSVKGIGMYGSYASGTNDEKSDLDLWVKVDQWNGRELADAKLELSKRLGRDIQLTVIDEKELIKMKKGESPFYYSLYFASELLWGESLD